MAKQDPIISDPPGRNSSMNSRIEENTTTSAALKENIKAKYDLSKYLTIGSPEYFSFQNQRYMRVKYQGDHEGEYAIFSNEGENKAWASSTLQTQHAQNGLGNGKRQGSW